jgi:hypothetical protein
MLKLTCGEISGEILMSKLTSGDIVYVKIDFWRYFLRQN